MLEHSRVYQGTCAVGQRLSAYVRGSFLYRWLTAEPDPDVIVIDLRETWTVGPAIALLDRVFGVVERSATDSVVIRAGGLAAERTLSAPIRVAGIAGLVLATLFVPVAALTERTAVLVVAVGLLVAGTVALFEDRSWAELRETRPGMLLLAAFEPPAPPEEIESKTEPETDVGERMLSDDKNPEQTADGESK